MVAATARYWAVRNEELLDVSGTCFEMDVPSSRAIMRWCAYDSNTNMQCRACVEGPIDMCCWPVGYFSFVSCSILNYSSDDLDVCVFVRHASLPHVMSCLPMLYATNSATTIPRGSRPASMTTSRAAAAVAAARAEESPWTARRYLERAERPSRPERPLAGAVLGSGAC